ncbi:MAG: hypothetical protein SAMD01599839_21560 [Rectinema sp.]
MPNWACPSGNKEGVHGSQSNDFKGVEDAKILHSSGSSVQDLRKIPRLHEKIRYVPHLFPEARFRGQIAGRDKVELVGGCNERI